MTFPPVFFSFVWGGGGGGVSSEVFMFVIWDTEALGVILGCRGVGKSINQFQGTCI